MFTFSSLDKLYVYELFHVTEDLDAIMFMLTSSDAKITDLFLMLYKPKIQCIFYLTFTANTNKG